MQTACHRSHASRDEAMIETTDRNGILIVLSSPSGAGKSTMTRRLLEEHSDLRLSVSVTTRPPRPSEVDGRDYVFIPRERFAAMVQRGNVAGAQFHPERSSAAGARLLANFLAWEPAP